MLKGIDYVLLRNLVYWSKKISHHPLDTTSNDAFKESISKMDVKELRALRDSIDAICLIHPHVEGLTKKNHHELVMSKN